jgi:hypothetical protein
VLLTHVLDRQCYSRKIKIEMLTSKPH